MEVKEYHVLTKFNSLFGFPGKVYLLKSGPFHKLGITGGKDGQKSIADRVREHQTGNPIEVELVAYFSAPHAYCYDFEQTWHKKLDAFRVRGEWFRLPPEVLTTLLSVMRQRQQLVLAVVRALNENENPTIWDIVSEAEGLIRHRNNQHFDNTVVVDEPGLTETLQKLFGATVEEVK
jgi:hypothetical protein